MSTNSRRSIQFNSPNSYLLHSILPGFLWRRSIDGYDGGWSLVRPVVGVGSGGRNNCNYVIQVITDIKSRPRSRCSFVSLDFGSDSSHEVEVEFHAERKSRSPATGFSQNYSTREGSIMALEALNYHGIQSLDTPRARWESPLVSDISSHWQFVGLSESNIPPWNAFSDQIRFAGYVVPCR